MISSIRREVEKCGMTLVRGVQDSNSLIDLARGLGSLIENPDGNPLKVLRVVGSETARPNTLSASFGRGRFPLHTDTAFWSLPARFLVLRASGDLRRPTTVCPFHEIFALAGERLLKAVQKSVWTLKTRTGTVYSEMEFRCIDGQLGRRYDRQCMNPANTSAKEVHEYLSSGTFSDLVREITWADDLALVIDNWRVLHGRGPEPVGEEERALERIYVGESR